MQFYYYVHYLNMIQSFGQAARKTFCHKSKSKLVTLPSGELQHMCIFAEDMNYLKFTTTKKTPKEK